jgi:hypothetical protein
MEGGIGEMNRKYGNVEENTAGMEEEEEKLKVITIPADSN